MPFLNYIAHIFPSKEENIMRYGYNGCRTEEIQQKVVKYFYGHINDMEMNYIHKKGKEIQLNVEKILGTNTYLGTNKKIIPLSTAMESAWLRLIVSVEANLEAERKAMEKKLASSWRNKVVNMLTKKVA
jgi:hypothetical protein